MHYGWWPCLHCSGLRRRRPPRVPERPSRLRPSGRGDSRPAALRAASFHPPLTRSEGGHSAATRWSPPGCLPPRRRTWPGCRVSPPHQRGGGWCGVESPLHELCRLTKHGTFQITLLSIFTVLSCLTFIATKNAPQRVIDGKMWGTPCIRHYVSYISSWILRKNTFIQICTT